MAEHAYTPIRPTIITRRAIGAATALLALSGVAAAKAVEPVSPDAELTALATQFQAIETEYYARTEPYLRGAPEPVSNNVRVAWLVAEGHRLAEAIADIPAQTLAGFRAKAAVLLHYSQAEDGGWGNHDELLGYSLARDLLGRV